MMTRNSVSKFTFDVTSDGTIDQTFAEKELPKMLLKAGRMTR